MTHQEPTEEELAKWGAIPDFVTAWEVHRLIEALRSSRVETMEMLAADAAEISSLKVRVAELEAALDKYGEHDHSCPAYDTAHMPEAQRECDCGLGRLLTRTHEPSPCTHPRIRWEDSVFTANPPCRRWRCTDCGATESRGIRIHEPSNEEE